MIGNELGSNTLEQLRKLAATQWPGGGRLLLAYSKTMLADSLSAGRMIWQNLEAVNAEKERRHLGHVYGEPQPPPVGVTARNGSAAAAGNTIASALEQLLAATTSAPSIDEDAVKAIVRAEIARATLPTCSQISINGATPISTTGQHKSFGALLSILASRTPCMMIGPAGSGKTTAAHACAKALGLKYHMISCGPLPQDGKLLGYMDAVGHYVSTPLRECFESGGVFLFDEVDAAHPGTLVAVNALLANSCVTWPDGQTIARHADYIPVAAGNTFGTGADRQYVGRNQLDAATLDRFFALEWAYDWGLVANLLGIPSDAALTRRKSGYSVVTWYERVKAINGVIGRLGIRHIVGPRAALNGAKLLDAFSKADLEEGLIWKGLKSDLRRQIEGAL